MPRSTKKGIMRRCSKRCDQCLYSDARIVTLNRKADIEATCHRDGVHFICHKFKDVACRGWLEAHPGESQAEQVARRLAASCPDDFEVFEDVDPPRGFNFEP